MPPDPPNKERLRRSVVNRASNTTLGTPLCKKTGYAPDFPPPPCYALQLACAFAHSALYKFAVEMESMLAGYVTLFMHRLGGLALINAPKLPPKSCVYIVKVQQRCTFLSLTNAFPIIFCYMKPQLSIAGHLNLAR